MRIFVRDVGTMAVMDSYVQISKMIPKMNISQNNSKLQLMKKDNSFTSLKQD